MCSISQESAHHVHTFIASVIEKKNLKKRKQLKNKEQKKKVQTTHTQKEENKL